MIHIIGELEKARQEREALRIAMRLEKDSEKRAENKREFRKARNKVIDLRSRMKKGK